MPSDRHTAAAAIEQLQSGRTSSVELTEHYLDRITRLNPSLNAVLALDDSALAAAAASDARRAAGRTAGPLDGVPVLVKDNIEAVGLPASAGSRALLDSPPTADAPLVGRLRSAGLVLLGSTNLSEWANFRSLDSTSGWSAVGGQTRNPWNTDRNTSGSSSGSGSAVAAGLAPLAIGTETDGSIVSPAGVCGVVGFKPTLGRVPGAGIVPISSHQDTAGPMTRSVADAIALFSVLTGQTLSVPSVSFEGTPVSVWRPDGTTTELDAVLDTVSELLGAGGARLTSTTAISTGPFDDAKFDALLTEFAVELPAYLAARPGPHPRTWPELLAFNRADDVELSLFDDGILQRCEAALAAGGLTSPTYLAARASANAVSEQSLAGVLGEADFAITLTNSPAWPIRYGPEERFGVLTSSLCAVTGSPSVSLPAGFVDGLPIGISVLGRRGEDERVLGFAAALEALLPPVTYPLD